MKIVQSMITASLLFATMAVTAEEVTPPIKVPNIVPGKALKQLFGDTLKNASGEEIAVDTLAGKTIGIYFSAHWCPPCKSFTPKLVAFRDELVKQGKPFEVIFVSSDRTEDAMYSYMNGAKMNWTAIPYNSPLRQSLGSKYSVRGIPTLIIINAEGEIITRDGRGVVTRSGVAAFDSWK